MQYVHTLKRVQAVAGIDQPRVIGCARYVPKSRQVPEDLTLPGTPKTSQDPSSHAEFSPAPFSAVGVLASQATSYDVG